MVLSPSVQLEPVSCLFNSQLYQWGVFLTEENLSLHEAQFDYTQIKFQTFVDDPESTFCLDCECCGACVWMGSEPYPLLQAGFSIAAHRLHLKTTNCAHIRLYRRRWNLFHHRCRPPLDMLAPLDEFNASQVLARRLIPLARSEPVDKLKSCQLRRASFIGAHCIDTPFTPKSKRRRVRD